MPYCPYHPISILNFRNIDLQRNKYRVNRFYINHFEIWQTWTSSTVMVYAVLMIHVYEKYENAAVCFVAVACVYEQHLN